MDKLNKEYIDLLSEDVNPTEKIWRLDKRIKLAGACLITYIDHEATRFYKWWYFTKGIFR